MSLPLAKLDLLAGYGLAFAPAGRHPGDGDERRRLRAPLGSTTAGPAWTVALLAIVDAVLGTACGLFVSAFASTEFQAVQFMPAFVLPQILLCGLFVPVRPAGSAARGLERAPAELRRGLHAEAPELGCAGRRLLA